jgi:hypothetical protein
LAATREREIKGWSRKKKLALIENGQWVYPPSLRSGQVPLVREILAPEPVFKNLQGWRLFSFGCNTPHTLPYRIPYKKPFQDYRDSGWVLVLPMLNIELVRTSDINSSSDLHGGRNYCEGSFSQWILMRITLS